MVRRARSTGAGTKLTIESPSVLAYLQASPPQQPPSLPRFAPGPIGCVGSSGGFVPRRGEVFGDFGWRGERWQERGTFEGARRVRCGGTSEGVGSGRRGPRKGRRCEACHDMSLGDRAAVIHLEGGELEAELEERSD